MPKVIFAVLTLPVLLTAAPTYNKDIAPILNSQCALCHRPGEVAPFSLLTYQDAAKRAGLIANVTSKGLMPPWKPEPGFGKFQHERRLTLEQIALLAEWARAGAPEGSPKDKPPTPTFANGWQAGEPNLILRAGSGFTVPAEGGDRFQCFVLNLNLEQDSYIQTLEFRPSNRKVVHHAVIYADDTGAARKLAASSPDGSYTCFGGPRAAATVLLGAWAPGIIPVAGDPTLSAPIRKGTDLVLQIHYHPSGKVETDASSLGITFSGPPTRGRTSLLMVNTSLDIAPGDSHYVAKYSLTVPRDVDLDGIFPHSHWLCKDVKVEAHLPNGETEHLVWIRDWDFNWQGIYRYQQPVHLPKGTRVDMEYIFDNSAQNPRNPSSPPQRVRFGEQTTDEMAVAVLSVILPTPADVPEFQRDMRLSMIDEMLKSGGLSGLRGIPGLGGRGAMLFQRFDTNHDGKLDDTERAALIDFLRTMMR